MTAPSGPPSPALSAAVESLVLQVNRDTVLQARAVVLGEVQRLRDSILFGGEGLRVDECGGDPVSQQAASAFTERVTRLVQDCAEYVRGLELAGDDLGQMARNYGYTEDEIAASLAR